MTQLKLIFTSMLLTIVFALSGQMYFDGETLWGNEWIAYDQDYYKFLIKEDGVYKITGSELQSAGLNIDGLNGSEIQVFSYGKQVPIYVSNNGNFGPEDFILLEGRRNDGELDKQLFGNPQNEDWVTMQFNP